MTTPLFPRAWATFSSPGTYLAFAWRFLTLPLAAPFVTERRFRGHAEVMYLTRFMLPETLRRWRWSGAAALPLVLYVSPLWCVAAAATFFYGAHRPEFLLSDVAFPALVSALLVSLAAACAAACARVGTTEHPPRAHSGQLRPSHAFPGGGPSSRTTRRESSRSIRGWTPSTFARETPPRPRTPPRRA